MRNYFLTAARVRACPCSDGQRRSYFRQQGKEKSEYLAQHSLRFRVPLTNCPFESADRFYRWKGMTLCPLSITVTL